MSLTAEADRDRCRFCLGECRRGRPRLCGPRQKHRRQAPIAEFFRVLCALLRDLRDLRLGVLRSLSTALPKYFDHGYTFSRGFMEEIAISKFKATCLAVLEKVRKTGKPVLVTRFGQPVAEVVPPPVKQRPIRDLGALRGTARITGDIVSPASDEDDWEVLRS
jgi:prevent-host-death family protein